MEQLQGVLEKTPFEQRLMSLQERSFEVRDYLAMVKHDFGASEGALKLLNKGELAQLLGISVTSVRKLLQSDPNFSRMKVTGEELRFNKAAVLQYIVAVSMDWQNHMDLLYGLGFLIRFSNC